MHYIKLLLTISILINGVSYSMSNFNSSASLSQILKNTKNTKNTDNINISIIEETISKIRKTSNVGKTISKTKK